MTVIDRWVIVVDYMAIPSYFFLHTRERELQYRDLGIRIRIHSAGFCLASSRTRDLPPTPKKLPNPEMKIKNIFKTEIFDRKKPFIARISIYESVVGIM